jgi:arabinogalactan oligomer / maltooligosaccharide transport system substrate-binding protein
MKRWSLLAVSLMLVILLAACGGNGGGNGGNDANGSAADNPAAANGNNGTGSDNAGAEDQELQPEPGAKLMVWEAKEQQDYMRIIAQDFEAKYGIPVTVEELAGGDQGGRLATDGPAKLAADILTLPHDQLAQAVKAGLLLPNDVFEEATRATSVETAIDASSYEGVLYGYPKSVETYALFYNKDIFPEAPKTWDEIVQFAQGFNNPNENTYAVMWEFVGYYTAPFIASSGGYFFGKDNTDPADIGLNSPGAVEGFEFLQSLKPILPMNAGDVTYDVKTELFAGGKLALNIDGPWSVAAFKDKVNFGVAPLPKLPNGNDSVSFSGVKSYYVNSYTAYPIAARLFANFASGKEYQIKNYEMTGAIPANTEAGEDPRIKEDPYVSGFFAQFGQSMPMPAIGEMNAVWDPLKAAFTTVWDDPNADVKETLDTLVETIKTSIASD